MKPLLLEVFRLAQPQLEALIEEYIQMYKELHQGDSLTRRMETLRGTIDTVQKKKQKLLAFNAQGALSDRDFLTMNAQCTAELEAAEAELEELTAQRDSAADFKQKIDTIRQTLRNAQRDAEAGIINKEFVDKYIDRIFATPEDSNTLHLQIKLSTGEIVEKTLENLRVRTGHTFKKMIEAYEQGMQ